MTRLAFSIALVIRSLSLLLPQTYFQPDEFYQALEPAHRLVFGFGHLTWEWRDLPYAGEGLWAITVVGGRMRSWLWPEVFAEVYKLLVYTGLDSGRILTFAPRVVGVLVAALTDWSTCRLAKKVLGEGAGPAALFLSLTSLFNAHLLTRSLSTSPETLLTVLALTYFPLPHPETPRAIVVGEKELVASPSMMKLSSAKEQGEAKVPTEEKDVVKLSGPQELNYAVMDRIGPDVTPREDISDDLAVSAMFATIAICIRPTTLPFWAYMGLEYLLRPSQKQATDRFTTILGAIATAGVVLLGATTLDHAITGRVVFPILTFFHQNFTLSLSEFYGSTTPIYHLTQSLPIMFFPIWWWWIKGFVSCLLPTSHLPADVSSLDRPAGLRMLARGTTFAIAVLSLSPHSEWRFLHPYLPALLLFALPPLFKNYTPALMGLHQSMTGIRQYMRLPKRAFWLIFWAPIIPYIYLNMYHGRAQVQVMEVLRRGDLGTVRNLVALVPCHSVPWQSHLHTNVPAWFLTCEPPLGVHPHQHHTQQSLFYALPVTYLTKVFPYPPDALHKAMSSVETAELPSHVILFGELLDRSEKDAEGSTTTVRDVLGELGYSEKWAGWNGFDMLQDEEERRGGVRVWTTA